MSEQKNALVVAMPQLFGTINFNELNSTIEKLATSGQNLTEGDKKLALEVVDNWNNAVVAKLDTRASDVAGFLHFFGHQVRGYYSHNDFSDDQKEDLATSSGTMDLYLKLQDAEEELRRLRERQPIKDEETMQSTFEEKIKLQQAYELESAKHNIAVNRLQRKVNVAEREWKDALLQDPNVKEAVTKAKKFFRGIDGLKQECKTKASMAKLNVSISSEEARKDLMELLNFVIKM